MTLLRAFPVVAMVGPRQCGKSTLAHHILPRLKSSVYLDLELPSDIAKLRDPEAYLSMQSDSTVPGYLSRAARPRGSFPEAGPVPHAWIGFA